MVGSAVKGQQVTRRLPHPAFGAIALNCAADLTGRRKAHADTGIVVGPTQRLNRYGAARQ